MPIVWQRQAAPSLDHTCISQACENSLPWLAITCRRIGITFRGPAPWEGSQQLNHLQSKRKERTNVRQHILWSGYWHFALTLAKPDVWELGISLCSWKCGMEVAGGRRPRLSPATSPPATFSKHCGKSLPKNPRFGKEIAGKEGHWEIVKHPFFIWIVSIPS